KGCLCERVIRSSRLWHLKPISSLINTMQRQFLNTILNLENKSYLTFLLRTPTPEKSFLKFPSIKKVNFRSTMPALKKCSPIFLLQKSYQTQKMPELNKLCITLQVNAGR